MHRCTASSSAISIRPRLGSAVVLCFAFAGPSLGFQGAAATQPDRIPSMVSAVSAQRIEERIRRLVGFHTRNTLSQTDSETVGIGAARRWIEEDLRASSQATGGKLEVRTQSTRLALGPKGAEHEVEVVNVYGFLAGRQNAPTGAPTSSPVTTIRSRATAGTSSPPPLEPTTTRAGRLWCSRSRA
jgi:hypothetical protein